MRWIRFADARIRMDRIDSYELKKDVVYVHIGDNYYGEGFGDIDNAKKRLAQLDMFFNDPLAKDFQ